MGRRIVLLIVGVVVLGLMMSSVALAATSQDIYDDFLDGKLDGTYTDAELRLYLNDATLHMYGDSSVIDRLDDAVNDALDRDTFPFTGFQMLIAGIVAIGLVGGGLTLRRFSRSHSS